MRITNLSSNNEIKAELGERIKQARIAVMMTQKEMAERTCLSVHAISDIEHGKGTSFDSILEIMRVLKILQNADELISKPSINVIDLYNLDKKRERARKKK